jgi:hypothetical protein
MFVFGGKGRGFRFRLFSIAFWVALSVLLAVIELVKENVLALSAHVPSKAAGVTSGWLLALASAPLWASC